MGFNCGIVGLPNVGKSTLFNAITNTTAAAAANYPFCTIEPNIGRVPVPDPRLDTLARLGEVGQDHPDPARDQGHRRAGPRRLQGRGAGQQVPGCDPRGRRGPAGAALLRGSRRHPCRGQRRSLARRRADRDRAAAGRSREPGAAEGRPGQARARPGQGGQGAARAARPHPARPGGRPAGARRWSLSREERGLLAELQPADRQARPLCLQRRRGLGRRRQRADRAGGGAGAAAGCAPRRDLCGDRGRALGAGRGREGRVSGQHRAGGAGPQPGHPRRATSCWACSPSSPSGPRRRAPGPCTRGPPARRPPA